MTSFIFRFLIIYFIRDTTNKSTRRLSHVARTGATFNSGDHRIFPAQLDTLARRRFC